ncbi:MAG TPA: cyclic nucleotide-binding domain-containing protein [Verrucomicrobiae bacterium]|nr:cyclic nucleotide-binding domain-containing protein [Verrucomicrobiae bacterium]
MNPFRNFRFLDGLRLKHLGRMMECANNVRFEVGERLFIEGEPALDLFLIKSGSVALHRSQRVGRRDRLKILGAGDVIGCPCLSALEWPVTGYALEPTMVLILHGARLRELVEEDPEFGREWAKRIGGIQPRAARMKRDHAELRVGKPEWSEAPTEGVVSLVEERKGLSRHLNNN